MDDLSRRSLLSTAAGAVVLAMTTPARAAGLEGIALPSIESPDLVKQIQERNRGQRVARNTIASY
jgi:hypothetical protein